jgi:outer membrane biosynthesis protein TonB
MKTSARLASALLIFCISALFPSAYSQTEQVGPRKVVSKVLPAYPRLARDLSLTGTVKLEVLVGSNGVAKSIQVKGGNPLLAQSAQEALHSWRWEKADHESSEMLEFTFKPQQ